MHLPALNVPDLYLSLWRGTIDCDCKDDKNTWDWAVFRTLPIWKEHGKEVAAIRPYIPGSFDRPPWDPAEKLNSRYKAWEFLLYFFGLGPCLFYGLLPHRYWKQYCKLSHGILLLLQEEISQAEIVEANVCLSESSTEFEELYVQWKPKQVHFVWPSVHGLSHMPHETLWMGPGIIYSQWTMEHTIGNLGEEINQHSNPYINALKAMIPDIDPIQTLLPRGSQDIGNGYVLLCACDSTAHPAKVDQQFHPHITRWARLRLPNGQIVRSRWKEDLKELNDLRMSRNVTINLEGTIRLAEIHFFTSFFIHNGSFYGQPHEQLRQDSLNGYITVQHFWDIDIKVFNIKSISSVVMLAPHPWYARFFQDGSEKDRYFLMRRIGLKMGGRIGNQEEDVE
ncbi:hypothetical protein EV368DRAFT_76080 [Lentinula lateritia]|nr:hypothetical protein EV368DRAFT_76080 [Lentinula lateritia]